MIIQGLAEIPKISLTCNALFLRWEISLSPGNILNLPRRMNEVTLNALINLYAIFTVQSKLGKESSQAAFSTYIRLQLGITSPDEYLRLFDELIDLYGIDGEPSIVGDMNSQAGKIAGNLKSRLPYKEQIMIFLRFLELTQIGEKEKAGDLINILAGVFSISPGDVEKYKQLVFYSGHDELNSSEFLLISGQEHIENKGMRHIYRKNFDGELLFMFLPALDNYIFNFRGKENISLEGNAILPNRFYAFREGSILRGPRIEPVYYSDITAGYMDENKATSFVLRGENIEFRFKNSSNGIYPFSFYERSGQLIAVMGGSGVGKSTLLNILNGTIPVDKGHIYINNLDVYLQKKETEGLIGFVPQDDLLFEELTVWENLWYNARLCFDELDSEQIESRIRNILTDLELYEFKDLVVGSPLKKTISGGQRKRLNVALELIREPSILFVDEPTSGLSSMDSEKIMLLLKEQARKGKIIMVNIHQPSSAIFKLFDKLWILDKGGRPIYTGNPLDAIIYFKSSIGHVNSDECECIQCGNVNPEQVLEIVETKRIDESGFLMAERHFSPEYWYKQYKETIEKKHFSNGEKNTSNPTSEFRKPAWLKQFLIFFQRNFRIKLTDKQYLIINLLEAPVLAAIVSYYTRFSEHGNYVLIDNKNLISYMFMSIVVVLFMGMSVSAEEIIKDRKVLQRESFLNLSWFSYLNSKIVFLMLLSAFQTITFVLVGNLILGIHGLNFVYWIVFFSVSVFSNMMGLNISSAFDSVVTIYILIPLLLIPQILLCGIIVKFDDLQDRSAVKDVVPVAGELMVSRWAFEALAVAQYKDNKYMANFFDLEKELARSMYLSSLLLPELTSRIDQLDSYIRTNKPMDEIVPKMTIVRNEFWKLNTISSLPAFAAIDNLNPSRFSKEIADSARHYLKKRTSELNAENKRLKKQKDDIVAGIEKSRGNDYLVELSQNYRNKALDDLVLNATTRETYRETPGGLMQKVAPIYKRPDFNNGRAHFMSSEKRVAGVSFSTFSFNLFVIWMMSLVLYLALYYNWLRKILKILAEIRVK